MQNSEQKKTQGSALRGQGGRIARNVLWSWGGHLVYVVGGFLLPRAIDHHGGPSLVGIWDFGWSIITYFALIEFGVSSSVNRYVAKHLAEGDTAGLNRTVSSVLCIQMMVGLVILALTAAAVVAIPVFWQARLGDLAVEAQWLVFCLGTSSAIGFGFGAFGGVLTGCHRWDLYNIGTSASYALTVTGAIIWLSLGGGLRVVGALYTSAMVLQVLFYAIAAHRSCPGLRPRPSCVTRATMRQMLAFGGKTFMNGLARSFLYQTSSLLMAGYLGPVLLAVYSRPMALVQHVRTITTKFAHTLTPVASEMDAAGHKESLQEMAVSMARVAAALALPPVVFLSLLGGNVLELWMGKDYRNDLLPLILACGHLWAVANLPLQTILIGLNAHGRPAAASVISAALCAGACWVVLAFFGGGVLAVALCVGVAVTLTDGVYVTLYTCSKLGLSVPSFLRRVWTRPLLCVVPFAIWLAAARQMFSSVGGLLWGMIGGGAIVALLYWHFIMPESVRSKLRSKWASFGGRFFAPATVPLKPGSD